MRVATERERGPYVYDEDDEDEMRTDV